VRNTILGSESDTRDNAPHLACLPFPEVLETHPSGSHRQHETKRHFPARLHRHPSYLRIYPTASQPPTEIVHLAARKGKKVPARLNRERCALVLMQIRACDLIPHERNLATAQVQLRLQVLNAHQRLKEGMIDALQETTGKWRADCYQSSSGTSRRSGSETGR
jgi:hypothetical protein